MLKNIYVIFYHVLEHIHPILYSHNPELFLVAMSKERATWNWRYEKGLVDTMRDHVNIPMFRVRMDGMEMVGEVSQKS